MASQQPIINHSKLFSAFDAIQSARVAAELDRRRPRNALETFMHGLTSGKTSSGFNRMQKCRDALNALDRSGWQRSFHQRLFHDNFIRACARIFWKTEPAGSFARDHQKILEMNGWDHLSQEILVSTPRRCVFHNPSLNLLADPSLHVQPLPPFVLLLTLLSTVLTPPLVMVDRPS